MIHKALYILLIVSLVNGLPNSFPGLGEWISFPSNSENETVDVKNDIKPIDPVRRVIDESDKDVIAVNRDKPIPVDDYLDDFENKVKKSDDDERKEMEGVLVQLRNAISNESMRRVNVLYKGIWRLVDLGIAGTTQRTRSAEKTEGVLQSIANVFKAVNKWFWKLFGYPMDDDEEKHDEDENDKDKDKIDLDKEKDPDKDPKNKKKKLVDEKETKPLSKEPKGTDPDTHTTSNGKLVFDKKWQEGHGGQSLEGAMKSLADLSTLLGDKLKTREEVDKELKEARDKRDINNVYYKQAEEAKKLRETEKDPREWTEAEALKKLDEMNKDFDKTSDKASMVKDVNSLSMQPLYYIETYDKIMDMVDRLKKSGVPEKDLMFAEDSALEQKLFSLEHSIQQTSRKQYQTDRRKKHAEATKKEREDHKDTREWTEEEAKKRLDEMDKTVDTTTDKSSMVKDLTSLSMQPFYSIETYDRIFEIMKKLHEKGVPEQELKTAGDTLRKQSRFAFIDSLLQKSELQEHEKYKIQSDKAKETRQKHQDTREFTEEQALKNIDDMNSNFDSKEVPTMVKDVTNLSMQPLYHVETYAKLSGLVDKLKKKGVLENDLKPAVDSLAEQNAFSLEHDLRQKPQGSLEEKLHNLKTQYIKPVALNDTEKQSLLKELEPQIRGQQQFTQHEAAISLKLLQALRGDNSAVEPAKVAELYQLVLERQKNATDKPKLSKEISSADVKSLTTSHIDPAKFQLGKFVDGKLVPA